jgi:PhnB protein
MHIIPYLNFNGSCEEAFTFYAKALNGKIDSMVRHEGTPSEAQVPAEWRKKILHASVIADGATILGSDVPPGQYVKPQGFGVTLQVKTPEDADRAFAALADGGTVRLPIQKTFFSPRFGMLVDRFDIPWMINCVPTA